MYMYMYMYMYNMYMYTYVYDTRTRCVWNGFQLLHVASLDIHIAAVDGAHLKACGISAIAAFLFAFAAVHRRSTAASSVSHAACL